MSYGYDRQPDVLLNNTATLTAYLYGADDALVPAANITSVTFTVVLPTDNPATPSINAVAGSIAGDGTGTYTVATSYTTVAGQYKAIATFTYTEATITKVLSRLCPFEVSDPFEAVGPTPAQPAIDQAWLKLTDCFDSEQGGPWLRDMTLSIFDKSKLYQLLPEALLEINQQTPYTSYTETTYPYDGDSTALLAYALLMSSIRHLMRSYTEQPDMTGTQVGWADRRKYQQAWSVIYQIEKERYDKFLWQWKLRQYDLSNSAMLVASKAGRLLPGVMRSRNIGRGYY